MPAPSDIDIAVADSLKVLDLKRPIREEKRPRSLGGAICREGPTTVYRTCSMKLVDYLVGAGNQCRRHDHTERLGGF
jgi:hypothetical protein